MKQYNMHKFILIPLTPIHIGGGDESNLTPDEYRIKNNQVELISVRQVLNDLTGEQREQWLRDCKKGADIAVKNLQDRADDKYVTGRIRISPDSHRELDPKRQQKRRGEINFFIRSGNNAILPGSSLKGVLRTAWLDKEMKNKNISGTFHDGKSLEKKAFGLGNNTEKDPFADIIVRDTALPDNKTIIDKIHTWKKVKQDNGHKEYDFTSVGQLHKERSLSVCDGGSNYPRMEIEIGIRDDEIKNYRGEKKREISPDTPVDNITALIKALHNHHKPLWNRELGRFFGKYNNGKLTNSLKIFDQQKLGEDAALIRIGWASHAECKSIDGFRKIRRPQAKGEGRIAKEGTTRHVVKIGKEPIPFGWALLIKTEKWQEPKYKAPSARTTIIYAKGSKVKAFIHGYEEIVELLEDVSEKNKDEEVNIRFSDGDTDICQVKDIKGLANE